MVFYSYDKINECRACLRFVTEVLGLEVRGDRIRAVWRGGDGFNVAVCETGWFDHVTKDKGGVIDLCAMTKFGGRDEASKQQAQEFLGKWLGLTPDITPERIKYDYQKHSVRYAELVRGGYAEARRYVYRDEAGLPAHYTVRMEHPTKPKTFFQCTPWSGSLKGQKLYLYNLPEILRSDYAVVVEGEKDADTLIAMGIPGTTCNCGADNWRDDYTESLRGKDVVVCRDNDDAGSAHAHLLMRSLWGAAKSIRVICPSKLPKGDVTDWMESEGGSKDRLLDMMRAAPEVTKEEAMWSDEELSLHRAKEANKRPFANYRMEPKVKGGKEQMVYAPRTMMEMVEDVHTRFLGFPRRLGKSTLFDHDRGTGLIEFMQGSASVTSWIGEKSKAPVMWRGGGSGLASKDELYAALMRNCVAYEKVSDVPDYPLRRDVYYTYRDALKPTAGNAALDGFLSFFNPGDAASAVLMRTFVAALMYYSHGIQRPSWIIDSRDGQAAGKTTFAEMVCTLYKCAPIKTSLQELRHDAKELNKRIVSVTGRNSRMLLVDNVRGVFDDPYYADLATGFSISGKAPYGIGEESRPNDLTYVVTSNSATIGSDIASRSFILYVAPPKVTDGTWKSAVLGYIERRRYEILGDVFDILGGPGAPDGFRARTRVPEFERDVLWKMAGGADAYEMTVEHILASRSEANVDEENAVLAVETLKEVIREALGGCDPDRGVVFLRSNLVNYELGKALRIDIQDLRNMVNTGRIRCIRRDIRRYPYSSTSPLRSSGVMFVGDRADAESPIRVRILGLSKEKDAYDVTSACLGIEDGPMTEYVRRRRESEEFARMKAESIEAECTERRNDELEF